MDIRKKFKLWHKDFICGHCFSQSGYDAEYATVQLFREGWIFDEPSAMVGTGVSAVKCRECGELSIILLDITAAEDSDDLDVYHAHPDEHPELLQMSEDEWGIVHERGQYPFGLILDKSVPEPIRADLQEAYNCLAIGAKNSSVLMSRRAVQQIVLEFAIPGISAHTGLSEALAKARDAGNIDAGLYEQQIEVKSWGDLGAHPGSAEPIDLEEAKTVATLVTQLAKRIYPDTKIQSTAEYLRERRWQKKAK